MHTPELLSDPVYHDEEAARLYIQEARWPDGVYCPPEHFPEHGRTLGWDIDEFSRGWRLSRSPDY